MVTQEGCSSLDSALSSNPSHLRELDLSYNHPGDSGVKLLSERLNHTNGKLEILKYVRVAQWLEHCVSSVKGCGFNSQGTHVLIKKFIA